MMLDYVFYALVAAVAAYALLDWRRALLACIVLDALRDPLRKLTPDYPVAVTLSITVAWLAVGLSAITQERAGIQELFRRYPKLGSSLWFLVVSLLPGALISLVSYSAGSIFAVIGIISYLFPTIGMAAGYLQLRRPMAWRGVLETYCLANAFVLPTALIEAFKLPLPGLGGMGVRWIRQQSGGLEIDLICGWYRSPDLLGLHAAHVMMFGSVLALYGGRRTRWLWLPLVGLATVCLILSGRRKMMIIPAAFLCVWALGALRRGATATAKIVLSSLAAAAVAYKFWPTHASDDYLTYGSRTFNEGWDRFYDNIIGGFVDTLSQAGLMGWGLGTATQGHQLLATHTARTWQEDGISRFAAEFGIIGLILLAGAAVCLLSSMRRALTSLPKRSTAALLQTAWLAVTVANIASFAVSHQAYSGDPSSIAIASLFLGYVFSVRPEMTTTRATVSESSVVRLRPADAV